MDDPPHEVDLCRVCRTEGTPERPLFHPCICRGTIKYTHMECLVLWIHNSGNHNCLICNHRYDFEPMYAPDMPRRLPVRYLAAGVFRGAQYWLRLVAVGSAWLCVVPFTSSWIYRRLFYGSFDDEVSKRLDPWSSTSIIGVMFHGVSVTACSVISFTVLLSLADFVLDEGGPDWLEGEDDFDDQQQFPDEEVVEEDDDGEDGREDVDEGLADRPPEDWKQLLGLDGSFKFLNLLFCVMFMNALFIMVFLYLPRLMGTLGIAAVSLQDEIAATHFEGSIATIGGYCLISMCLSVGHTFATSIGLGGAKRYIGLGFIIVKIILVCVVAFGVLPLVCGWWLDICSLPMFDTSFKARVANFHLAPGTSVFIHWGLGVAYMYYFNSFESLVRVIVRPGVLWLFENHHNPDLRPDLVQQSLLQHGRNLISILTIVMTSFVLAVWVPIQILKCTLPSFLPYNVASQSDSVENLSMEVLLLIVLPALLVPPHTRHWLKTGVRRWCAVVSRSVGINSHRLDDAEEVPEADLGIDHEGLLGRYSRPAVWLMLIRSVVTLVIVAIAVVAISVSFMTVPVWLGRLVLSSGARALFSAAPGPYRSAADVHELYTAVCGTCVLWLSAVVVRFVATWWPRGHDVFVIRLKFWLGICSKTWAACFVLLGVIPFLFGSLVDLVAVAPFRPPSSQSPDTPWTWLDWALGVLYVTIACAVTLVGPDWPVKRSLKRIYRDGLLHLDLTSMMRDLAAPVICALTLSLAVPHALAYYVVPLVVQDEWVNGLVARAIYQAFAFSIVTGLVTAAMVRRFETFYQRVRDENYLLGINPVNYNR